MKKLSCLSRTLENPFVKEGLCAVSTLNDFPESRDLTSVVGGIAVHTYLPNEYRRPTNDIDLLVGRPLNYKEFKQFSKPVWEYLQDRGYGVNSIKLSGMYVLLVDSLSEERRIIIEFSRRNEQNYEKHKKHIERELMNSRKKIIEGKDITCSIISPEDIALPKLVRSINILKRRPDLKNKVLSYELQINNGGNRKRLEEIKDLRELSCLKLGNSEITDELRFISDLYDIRCLSELVGYNEDYINEASKDWLVLNEESSEKDQILKILPKIQLIF